MPAKPRAANDERGPGLFETPPMPPEIARSPQLAVLTVLDAALVVADDALLAEHPELWDHDRPSWRQLPDSQVRQARIADAIIGLARRLRGALGRYRQAIVRSDEEARSNDVPF